MANDDIPYLLRGVVPGVAHSSLLTSTSRYLNSGRLREWLAMICLRRNGEDFPPQAEMYEFMSIINEIRDFDYIEKLFTEERKINPALDAWFNAWHVSDYAHAGLADCAEGTVGHRLYQEIIQSGYELETYALPAPKSQFDFFNIRASQNHDLEHILTGGGIDYMGELVPYWYRITSHFKFLSPELAGEVSVLYLLGSLRYTVRTMLHYPQCWPTCQNAIERGMRVGRESDALFMADYEAVLNLPITQARAALGVRGAEDVDTAAVSWQWAEISSR